MNLRNAIRQLEQKHAAVINLEVLHPAFVEQPELALAPDQYHHHGAFCRWAKNRPGGNAVCFDNKNRSRRIAAYGRPFHGCCPNGIWDYARPVLFEKKLAAIIYLGYFSTPDREYPPEWSGRRPPELTAGKCRELGSSADFLAAYVLLELEHWRESETRRGKKRDGSYYLEQCLRFIERTYHLNPALGDLADILHVNANYLGSVVYRASGKSFREHLTERRLQEAEVLLRHQYRQYAIGEIGQRCGFSDSNYFCTVFKQKTGVPPREFIRLYGTSHPDKPEQREKDGGSGGV